MTLRRFLIYALAALTPLLAVAQTSGGAPTGASSPVTRIAVDKSLAEPSPEADKPAAATRKSRKAAAAEEANWRQARAAARATIDRRDPVTRAAFWATEYNENPKDRDVTLHFIAALADGESWARVLEVADDAIVNFGEALDFALPRARALVFSDRAFEAVQNLRRLDAKNPQDWRVASALGLALDAAGIYPEAVEAHRRAQALEPRDAKLVANLGFAVLLNSDPAEASRLLSAAHDMDRADVQIAQNLMLALGVQGKFAEAERVAADSLPPDLAANNLAFLKAMLSEQRRWGRLSAEAASDPAAAGSGTSAAGGR